MRFRLSILVILWASACLADNGITVTNLYDINGFLPGFLIPFQVGGTQMAGANAGAVQSYSVTSDNATACGLMQDPFISMNYLLKCSASCNATLHFIVNAQGTNYPIDYGPVAIIQPAGIVVGGGGTGPSQGQVLFNQYCAHCHSQGLFGGVLNRPTVTQIDSQIASNPNMSSLQGQLTQDQITAIATYLGTL